jgi:hypothetical protein
MQWALTRKKAKYNMSRGRDASGFFMVSASVVSEILLSPFDVVNHDR